MINQADLKQHYYELIEELKSTSYRSNVPEELFRMAYASDWIRIFLIGNVETHRISIQVELTPFLSTLHDEVSKSISSEEMETQASIREFIECLIRNLTHLLRLNDDGFTLGLIEEECLWFAEKTLETEPTDMLYNALINFPNKLIDDLSTKNREIY